jgi:uncharacterized protein YigA (DUF484 family)
MMRIFLLLICFSSTYAFSQSKKEQIEYLNLQLDSIRTIQIKELQLAKTREAELNATISQLRNKISALESTLESVKSDLEKNKIILSEKDSNLAKIEKEVKSLRDSLQFILENMPIQLIDSAELSLTNGELIQLINILPSELGPEFISEMNPVLKPTFEIQRRQVFEWKGKKYALVVVGVTNPNDYHAASGTNYLTLLEWNSSNWIVKLKINTHSIPSVGWGLFASLEQIIMTGKESISIILSGGYTSGGIIQEYEVIYQFCNYEILNVFEGLLLENDGANFGNIDNQFKRSFIDNGREFFDLKETKKSHGKVVSSKVFKFNPTTQKYE